MRPRIAFDVARIVRPGQDQEVLCLLMYEETLLHEDMFTWFLIWIEELE